MITALPELPTSSNPSNFASKGDAFLAALPDFIDEVNTDAALVASTALTAVQDAVEAYASEVQASTSEGTAFDAIDEALEYGNEIPEYINAALWVSGNTYALDDVVYSPTNLLTYRRVIAGAGTTDPYLDLDNWKATVNEVSLPYPDIYPSLNLDFCNSQIVDSRITFTRASTATRTNSKGLIEVVSAGVPRIDYDPITLACRGLLVEESRTNLLWPSIPDSAGTSYWANGTAITSVTNNAAVSPDGTVTATAFVGLQGNSNSGAGSSLRAIMGVLAAGTYTVSFYARGGIGGAAVAIRVVDAGSGIDVAVTCSVSDGGSNSLTTAWRRYSATFTQPSGSTSCSIVFNFGVNSDTIYIWGAQLEAGSFLTSYIPTTTAAATLAADVAVMTGTNFSDWYRADEGTFVVETSTSYPQAVAGVVFVASDGTTSNRIQMAFGSSVLILTVTIAAVGQVSGLTEPASTANAFYKLALGYKENDFAMSVGVSAVDTDTVGLVPTGVTQLQIGHSTTWLNGHIRSIAYYPKRLNNHELQSLTIK